MAEPAPDGGPAVVVWGIDHHRTPVAIRERLACSEQEAIQLAQELTRLPGVAEAVVLSTCNRLECYLGGTPDPGRLTQCIAQWRGLEIDAFARDAYRHEGRAGVRHCFRVAAGLESLVLGEDQIVAQVRSAYEQARAAGLAGILLHPLFQRALAIAKDVRSQTGLGRHKLSVASVAVDLAKHVHGDLAGARLLLIGAGEIAELTVRYLREHGVRRISVVNRSAPRAEALAQSCGGTAYRWEQLPEALAGCDIVVSSTAAPTAILTAAEVKTAMRRPRGPLLLIDVAVPRDIDPAVAHLADVFLYNIDHLESVVAANRALRQEEVAAAAALVDAAVAAHCQALAGSPQQQLLAQIAAYFEAVVASEEARLAGKLGLVQDQRRRADLRYGLDRVASKLSHQVLSYLRAHPGDAEAERQVRALLGLDAIEPAERVREA